MSYAASTDPNSTLFNPNDVLPDNSNLTPSAGGRGFSVNDAGFGGVPAPASAGASGGMSADQQAALTAYYNAIGQYDWSGLLGQTTLGTPQAGMPTLAGTQAYGFSPMGTYANDPTLAMAEAAGEFGSSGPFAGRQTLAGEEALGRIDGQKTLAREGQEFNQGLGVANLVAGLNGPRDAFSQQAVEHGLDSMGLSKAVDAIAGRANLPTVQAPQAAPTAESLSSLVQSIRNGGSPAAGVGPGGAAGGGTGFSANDGLATPAQTGGSASNSGGAFSTPDITQRYIDALPDPNKIVGSEWNKLDPDTRDFLTGAYGKKGYSPSDLNQAINSNQPQFRAPTASNNAFGSGFIAP